jgi:hypothetical protein
MKMKGRLCALAPKNKGGTHVQGGLWGLQFAGFVIENKPFILFWQLTPTFLQSLPESLKHKTTYF